MANYDFARVSFNGETITCTTPIALEKIAESLINLEQNLSVEKKRSSINNEVIQLKITKKEKIFGLLFWLIKQLGLMGWEPINYNEGDYYFKKLS